MLMARRVIGVALTLFVAVLLAAGPAAAYHRDRRGDGRGRVEIRGRVIGVDRFGHVFHLQSHDDFGPDVVAVYVDGRTDFEFKKRRRGDFDVDARGLRFLQVGDVVEVEGRVIGRRAILARDVEVFRRHRDDIGFVDPRPVVVVPHPVVAGLVVYRR
jgi:hypothetical protein